MLYHDPVFIWLFLSIFLVFYYIFVRNFGRAAIIWVYGGSLCFYAYTEPRDLALLIWVSGIMLAGGHYSAGRLRRLVFASSVIGILAPLFFYKYLNFAASVVGGSAVAGVPPLPIGLSFYTFQALAFLGAVYRGGTPKDGRLADSWLESLTYLAFFPQLIAGPIVLPKELIPQLRRLRTLSRPVYANMAVGGTIFIFGFAKMALIAEPVSRIVDHVFASAALTGNVDLLTAWTGTVGYAVQIYFDFSAYSDMALGLARMFGIRLPINFWSPYRSRSLIDFWRRWHVTLGRFLSMALYRPLGGNRHGFARQTGAITLTMLLGGLWHGAGHTFLIWGLIHGVGLAAAHGCRRFGWVPPAPIGWFATMAFVMMAWVLFRAQTMETAFVIWKGLLGQGGILIPNRLSNFVPGALSPFVDFDGAHAYALLSAGGVQGLGAIVVGILISILGPNIYQCLASYRPALDHAKFIRQYGSTNIWMRPTFGFLFGIFVVGLFIGALYFGGAPQKFLYFQF